jgi:hypothetical protein
MQRLRWLTCGTLLLAAVSAPVMAGEKTDQVIDSTNDGQWVQLFNGKDLKGWKTHPSNPGNWRVQDGILVSGGREVSHLFSERGDYQDFRFRIEAKINDKGNSGQLFRAEFSPGYPQATRRRLTVPSPRT